MMSREGIRDAYASGRGSIKVRARAHVEPLKGGKEAIVVTELPFMVKKGGEGGLITKIADLARDKKLEGISDLRDESDERSGMRLVIELKRGGPPAKVVLNNLYKKTSMQSTFGANMVALVDGVPRTLEPVGADRALRHSPARGRHPPHPVRTATSGGARPHPRGPPGGARQPRRGDQTDPLQRSVPPR